MSTEKQYLARFSTISKQLQDKNIIEQILLKWTNVEDNSEWT